MPQYSNVVNAGGRSTGSHEPPRLVRLTGLSMAAVGLALLSGTVFFSAAGAQVAPPPVIPLEPPLVEEPPLPLDPIVPVLESLKGVPVPEPPNLADFVQDRRAAIQLGKALFWDMQVGSDGVTACASCHFQAGADNRTTNQISPGMKAGDRTFQVGGGPNYTLTLADFPFHKLVNPEDPRRVIRDRNDVVSSQGVFLGNFTRLLLGNGAETCATAADTDGFRIGSNNVRRVEPRNTPSVINAVFNLRNFWDGRANNDFNGVNPFGQRDPDARIWKLNGRQLRPTPVVLPLGSLASQAVGPLLSDTEMSCRGRTIPDVGRKILSLRPLAKQVVSPTDSVLGSVANSRDRRSPARPGISATYPQLIQRAFKREYWNAPTTQRVTINGGSYTQMEANFSLFFGLAIQLYEATLVSDDSPFDRFQAGNPSAMTVEQIAGMDVFEHQGGCAFCHAGPELTSAAVTTALIERVERMKMGNEDIAVYDSGFYNIGVRPTPEDIGLGGTDPFGNPLGEAAYCQTFVDRGELCPIKNMTADGQIQPTGIADAIVARPGEFIGEQGLQPRCPFGVQTSIKDRATGLFTCDRTSVLGTFKTPGLRNVELTGPYFHNGGQATLRQVVDFYNRGGDFGLANLNNLDPIIEPLGLTEKQKDQLVAFLLSLTDDRVKYERAPFDHPQLFVPNGHTGNTTSVTSDPSKPGQARDNMIEIPAVGASGRSTPLKAFLNPTNDPTFHFNP